MFADGVSLYLYVPPAAGVSTAVGLPAAAPAGPAGPAAASAQPSEARAAHHPARTDRPASALAHSGSVHNTTVTTSPTALCQITCQSAAQQERVW